MCLSLASPSNRILARLDVQTMLSKNLATGTGGRCKCTVTILRLCYVSQAKEQQTDLAWLLARPRAREVGCQLLPERTQGHQKANGRDRSYERRHNGQWMPPPRPPKPPPPGHRSRHRPRRIAGTPPARLRGDVRSRGGGLRIFRQHRLGADAQGGPSSYEPTVGAALHRAWLKAPVEMEDGSDRHQEGEPARLAEALAAGPDFARYHRGRTRRPMHWSRSGRASTEGRRHSQGRVLRGPDTLLQTDRDNSQKSTCRSGAGHTLEATGVRYLLSA